MVSQLTALTKAIALDRYRFNDAPHFAVEPLLAGALAWHWVVSQSVKVYISEVSETSIWPSDDSLLVRLSRPNASLSKIVECIPEVAPRAPNGTALMAAGHLG